MRADAWMEFGRHADLVSLLNLWDILGFSRLWALTVVHGFLSASSVLDDVFQHGAPVAA